MKQGEASKDPPTEPKKLQLNSAEELYAEIRDKNFNAVGAALSKKAKIISAAFEVRLVPDLPILMYVSAWILLHTNPYNLVRVWNWVAKWILLDRFQTSHLNWCDFNLLTEKVTKENRSG